MNPTDRETWTKYLAANVRRAMDTPKRQKYGARVCVVDGFPFDSQREAARFQELKLLQLAGLISAIDLHPGYPLIIGAMYHDGPPTAFKTIGMYHADFRYTDLRTGEVIVEDVKAEPTKTTAYRLRRRIVEFQHGITITEVI